MLGKFLPRQFKRPQMALKISGFFLSVSALKELKNSKFEISLIPQTANISN